MKGNAKPSKLKNQEDGVLSEAGIVFESGEIIKDDKIVYLARRGQELLCDNKFDEFEDLMYGPDAMSLTSDQRRLLSRTMLSYQNMNILEILCHLEVMNSPDVSEE